MPPEPRRPWPARGLPGVQWRDGVRPEEKVAVSRYDVYWFFRRKLRIVILSAACYAALC